MELPSASSVSPLLLAMELPSASSVQHQYVPRQPSKRPMEGEVAATYQTSRVTSPPPSKRPRLVTDNNQVRRSYQRYPKPPYTHLGMIVVAIETSPTKQLTLSGVQDALCSMFPFFKGSYVGWRDSVRHFLSSSPCFIKLSRKQAKKGSKGCLWTVDVSLVPKDAFKRLKVPPHKEKVWASTLTEQLRIPAITHQDTTPQTGEITPDPATPASLRYTEAQYTRYLRHQTQDHAKVPLNQYPSFTSLLYYAPTSGDYTEAAVNLHQLCPKPDYGSPVRAEREWTTKPITPTVNAQPTRLPESLPECSAATQDPVNEDDSAILPVSCLTTDYNRPETNSYNSNSPLSTHCDPLSPGSRALELDPPSEAAAYLQHFVNSLVESSVQNDTTENMTSLQRYLMTSAGQITSKSPTESCSNQTPSSTLLEQDVCLQQTTSVMSRDVHLHAPAATDIMFHCSPLFGDISDDVATDNDISILSFHDIRQLCLGGINVDK